MQFTKFLTSFKRAGHFYCRMDTFLYTFIELSLGSWCHAAVQFISFINSKRGGGSQNTRPLMEKNHYLIEEEKS